MSSVKFKQLCEKYFGTSDFYDILKVHMTASDRAIKKAYHKLSLIVHPDRVGNSEKESATEKFKLLGKIYSVLQDTAKRKLYDDFGECDQEIDLSFNWLGYWLSMFKKIEIKDIMKYEKEYIGSDIERRDIKKAYVISKGNMDQILEMVPFSSCESEPRIMKIIKKMVDKGEVKKYNAFFKESKQKKTRRRKKLEKEKRETASINMRQLEMDMDRNMRQRARRFEKLWSKIRRRYSKKEQAVIDRYVKKRTKENTRERKKTVWQKKKQYGMKKTNKT